MPRTKSVRAIIAEVVMYVGMFAVVGHMSQNLYERFMMQSTLNTMKSDLNTLELIVHNIELAYDTLREDIHDLNIHKESRYTLQPELKAPDLRPTYNAYLQQKRKNIDHIPGKQDMDTSVEKYTKDFIQDFKVDTKNFRQYWNTPAKNETTFTERLAECMTIGVGTNKKYLKNDGKGCKCIVKCITHDYEDDNFKLVNLHRDGNYEVLTSPKGGSCEVLNSQKGGVYKIIKFENEAKCNETNSTHLEKHPVCNSFTTLL